MTLYQKKLEALGKKKALQAEARALLISEGKTEAYEAKKKEIAAQDELIAELDALLGQEEAQDQLPASPVRGIVHGAEDPADRAVHDFAAAARAGFQVSNAASVMTEGTNADGGYTVPQEIVTRIFRLRESEDYLGDLVTRRPVTKPTGALTYKTRSQYSGFATVTEKGKYAVKKGPGFGRLTWSVIKRGDVLAVTEELLNDSDENITDFVVEWFGNNSRVTINNLVLGVVQAQTAVNLKDLDGITAAWLKLGVFRKTSALITNDDGLAWLATLKDSVGQYILRRVPNHEDQMQICVGAFTLPIRDFNNDTLSTDVETGAIPMILGDLKEGVEWFDRQLLTIKQSDTAVVGSGDNLVNAFEEDLQLFKGSQRDDVTLRDAAAFINGYVIPATETSTEETGDDTPGQNG